MTTPRAQLSGLVLAGGGSARMGTDKAVMRVEGLRLVDRTVAALRTICDDVVIASGAREIPGVPVPQVQDSPPDAGPLGGMVAGLTAVRHDLVAVLAVDMPTPDVLLLTALATRWRGESAVIPSADGQPQPLHAVWSRTTAPALALLLDSGLRSVLAAAQRVGALILDDLETASLVAHDRWAWNVNRPADLARGLREHHRPHGGEPPAEDPGSGVDRR